MTKTSLLSPAAEPGSGLRSRMLRIWILIMVIFSQTWAMASTQVPSSLPSPSEGNPGNFVSDPYDLLSHDTETYINERLERVRKKTTAEVALAVVRTTGDLSIEDYSYDLFRRWGIGKSDNNNGVLLVVAVDDRKCRIEVGSGLEGVLTDVACGNIVRRYMIPALREGNLNQAVSAGMNEICDVLTNPDVAKEIRSESDSSMNSAIKTLDKDVILSFLAIVAGFVFFFLLVMLVIDIFTTRKRDNYRRAMTWRSHLHTYWWGALISCGTALPIALIAWILYRHARDVTEICDSCGAKMKKLSEDEDNAFLTASQDFEEKLGTVDYDVWLCPECGTIERFPYVEKQLKYRECPECHTIAMNLMMDKVVEPPTTKREGHGERIYQCQFCKHIVREGYSIPKKTNDAALLAAGIAAGSILGSRNNGGGGGGFGGGFGGGHSSGGGASGSW